MGAHTREADLAGLLSDLLSLDQIIGDVLRPALAVEVPDVDVVRAEFRKALVDLGASRMVCPSVLVDRVIWFCLPLSAAPTMRSSLPPE
jgi:hypothetical protein